MGILDLLSGKTGAPTSRSSTSQGNERPPPIHQIQMQGLDTTTSSNSVSPAFNPHKERYSAADTLRIEALKREAEQNMKSRKASLHDELVVLPAVDDEYTAAFHDSEVPTTPLNRMREDKEEVAYGAAVLNPFPALFSWSNPASYFSQGEPVARADQAAEKEDIKSSSPNPSNSEPPHMHLGRGESRKADNLAYDEPGMKFPSPSIFGSETPHLHLLPGESRKTVSVSNKGPDMQFPSPSIFGAETPHLHLLPGESRKSSDTSNGELGVEFSSPTIFSAETPHLHLLPGESRKTVNASNEESEMRFPSPSIFAAETPHLHLLPGESRKAVNAVIDKSETEFPRASVVTAEAPHAERTNRNEVLSTPPVSHKPQSEPSELSVVESSVYGESLSSEFSDSYSNEKQPVSVAAHAAHMGALIHSLTHEGQESWPTLHDSYIRACASGKSHA